MAISFAEAIDRVGEWSQRNFGDQKGTGALAPFAGIIEEVEEARSAWSDEDIVDGFCDQLIYLADVCARSGITIDVEWNDEVRCNEAPENILIPLGELAHALLKRHQGIRGFDDKAKFEEYAVRAATEVFHCINADFQDESDSDLADEFEIVLDRVLQRDWVANPAGQSG